MSNESDVYAEIAGPLVSAINKAINEVAKESEQPYTEYDVYHALALSLTLFASRHLPEEVKLDIAAQSQEIAKQIIDSALASAEAQRAYMSAIVIGVARASSAIFSLIEASDMKNVGVTEEAQA
jgi:hypothetical protein